MARIVKISRVAEIKLEKLFNYLEEKWSLKVKQNFIAKLDKSIIAIQNEPAAFPKSTINKGLHKCVITKQISLYYRYDSHHIYIITLFDSRQNPNKLHKDLL